MQEYRTFLYEDGNAALEIPSYAPTREERYEEMRRRDEKKKKQRARARAHQMVALRAQALLFSSVIVILGFLFTGFVHIQNNITSSRSHITSLQAEISDLKAENAALQSRIDTSLNLNVIKDTAVNRLGMVYADTDQIVYYNMQDEDYMNQYESAP